MNNNLIKEFYSIDKKHIISINIFFSNLLSEDNVSFFEIKSFDFSNYKTFLLLFKDVVDFLSKNNVKYIKQYILKSDVCNFKTSEIININNDNNDNNDIVLITTSIENFSNETYNALGFKTI